MDTGVRGTLIIELRQTRSKSYVDMLYRSCEHNIPYASVVASRAGREGLPIGQLLLAREFTYDFTTCIW
jgi:hypothetical protein